MMLLSQQREKSYGLRVAIYVILILGSSLLVLNASVAREGDSSDEALATAGLNLLPSDLRARWTSLVAEADTALVGEYLSEGEAVIQQLGRLVEVLGGRPPEAEQASYAVYDKILNNLISLIDRIELVLIVTLPEDQQIEDLLSEYQDERGRLSGDVKSERQTLIDAGSEKLEEQMRSPYFRKFPHRRAIIADLYFRLTELTFQATEDQIGDEMDAYFRRYSELIETDPAAAAGLVQPKPNYSRVIRMYQTILDEFPETRYAVDALYNLAYLSEKSGDPDDKATANSYFETLVSIYPDSKYTLNALQRIGEYYFMPPINSIDRAVRIYERIAENYPGTEYYTEALYMLGWCYYRLSDLPTAVEYFAKTLDTRYTPEGEKLPLESVRDFAPESMKYICICFSVDSKEWDGAGVENFVAWLEANPERLRNYGGELLIQLGDVFREQIGHYVDGVNAYDKFVGMFPLDPRATEVQEKIVEVYQRGEIYDPQRAHTEKITYFETYNPDGEWWQANTDPAVRNQVVPVIERYLNMLVDEKLVLGHDTGIFEEFQEFERYSRQYLRFWPQGPNAYDVHYNLASVNENNLNLPMVAVREFWQVATVYPDTAHKEIACQRIVAITRDFVKREKAGELYISSQGEVLPPGTVGEPPVEEPPVDAPPVENPPAEDSPVEDPPVEESSSEGPLPEAPPDTAAVEEEAEEAVLELERAPLLHSEELMMAGFDLYIELFPNTELTPTILYQAGDILFQHDWVLESRPYLETLIAGHPDCRFVEDAYKLILQGYFKTDDVVGVEELARRIAEADVSEELKSAAYEHKAVSIFREAKSLKEGEDHIAAADEFLRVALETPDFKHADQALFQAGVEYTQGKAPEKANEAFRMVADRYPESEFADKSLYNLGFNLESDFSDLAGAAAVFEELATSYPQSDLARGALGNASINFNKVEDHLSAIRVNDLYVTTFPDAEDANVYLFENAGHYLKLNDIPRANEIYREFAGRYPDDPRTVQAYFERGKYFLDQGDIALAAIEFTATVEAHQRLVSKELTGSPKYTAQALSYLLAWEHEEYDKLRFTLPPDNLLANKARKKEWRNSLVDRYGELIGLGQKESYKAFYDIGRLDEELAQATYRQELPPIEALDKRLEYLGGVIDTAIVMNAVAVQSYRDGFQKLEEITGQLESTMQELEQEDDRFSELVAELQKDTAAVGVADSMTKLTDMRRVLSEYDSALAEARNWSVSCRKKVPEVASRDGEFLTRLWGGYLAIRGDEPDEEVRLLIRQRNLNQGVAPLAPEIAGFYLQALLTTQDVGVDEELWCERLEEAFSTTLDTLLAQYLEICDRTRARTDRYLSQYEEMLPRGEVARSPDGLYPDEMGPRILDHVDYLNSFSLDLLTAFTGVLDTVANYELPVGFGEEAMTRALEFVLDQYNTFDSYTETARIRNELAVAKYEETDEIQWDDAAVAYEDIAFNFADYGVTLLEEGFRIKQQYGIPGLAGINILRELVRIKPDEYASVVGIEPQRFTLISSLEWKVWPRCEPGFEDVDFDDSMWETVTSTDFPPGIDHGTLDSLEAGAIWYWRPPPAAVPKWVEFPEEVAVEEGSVIEFTVAGVAPERRGPEAALPEAVDLTITYSSEDIPETALFEDYGDGTGTFGWEATFDDAGSYTASFTLSIGDVPVTANVPIMVGNVDRGFEWVEVPESIVGEEASLIEFTLVGSDPDGDPLTIAYLSDDVSDSAQFVDQGDGTGIFTWQPTFDDSGSYVATFILSGIDTSLSVDVPIRVENAPRAPKWVDIPEAIESEEGSLVEFTAIAIDPEDKALTITFESEDIPDTVLFTDNGDGTATFHWETTFEDSGSYIATFTLFNGDITVSVDVPITIAEVGRAPVWVDVPESVAGEEDELIEFTVVGKHPDNKALTISYSSDDLPEAALFADNFDGSGTFTWWPTDEDIGNYTASFTLSDGELSVTVDVPIVVIEVESAPEEMEPEPEGEPPTEE